MDVAQLARGFSAAAEPAASSAHVMQGNHSGEAPNQSTTCKSATSLAFPNVKERARNEDAEWTIKKLLNHRLNYYSTSRTEWILLLIHDILTGESRKHKLTKGPVQVRARTNPVHEQPSLFLNRLAPITSVTVRKWHFANCEQPVLFVNHDGLVVDAGMSLARHLVAAPPCSRTTSPPAPPRRQSAQKVSDTFRGLLRRSNKPPESHSTKFCIEKEVGDEVGRGQEAFNSSIHAL